MKESWDKAIAAQLKNEGGYVNHPADPGGPTNMGITLAVLQKWRKRPVTAKDVQNLKIDEAAAIYKSWYWDAVSGDLLPSGLDYSVFDYGAASGPQKAVIELQKIVGAVDDGKIGNLTISKIADYGQGIDVLIDEYQNLRLAFYKRLSTWSVFGKGWEARIGRVRELSHELAKVIQPVPSENHTPKTDVQEPSGVSGGVGFWLRLVLFIMKVFI